MDECFIQPMTYGKLSHFQCFVIEKKKKAPIYLHETYLKIDQWPKF